MNDRIICHHGILGMKWGVIRSPSSIRKKVTTETETSADSKNKKEQLHPSAKSLSDQELKQIVNRIDMEKRYNQLTAKQKSAAQKFVSDVLTSAAKQTATKYAAQYMSDGVEYLLKKSK